MNRLYTLLLFLVFFALQSSVSEEKASIRFNFFSFGGEQSYIEFGVSDMATDTFDIQYDQEQPPFPPPGGMMPLTTLKNGVNSDGEQQYTDVNIDIRYAPAGAVIEKTFTFSILGSFSQTPWEICWSNPPKELVSGVLRDIYIPGVYQFEIDVFNEPGISCSNPYEIDKPLQFWEFVTTWELDPTSVKDIDSKSQPFKYLEGVLLFDTAGLVKIYDIQGAIVLEANTRIIDLSNLNKGTYIIVSEISGEKYIDKIIR